MFLYRGHQRKLLGRLYESLKAKPDDGNLHQLIKRASSTFWNVVVRTNFKYKFIIFIIIIKVRELR